MSATTSKETSTPMDVENRRSMFRRVMQKYQLRPENINKDRSQFHIHNLGYFVCGGCEHSWESAFSWLTFDLRELEIKKWWAMMCQECQALCYPSFQDDQLERMFEIAVQLYKGVYRPRGGPPPNRRQSPHKPPLCEKCEWGRTMCWLGRLHR